MNGHRPRVTLVTSNGWGLGHLSRETAIALAIGDAAEVTMFSFSKGLPLAVGLGVRGEFCQGHSTSWIPRERWNQYVETRFGLFVSEVRPDVVLFDGVAPYLGIINALLDHPGISTGWLRRGMWLPGRTESQLAKSALFDFVVEPGDIAGPADHGPTSVLEAIRVAPVSLLEVVPQLDRDEAASRLGLDPARPALLVGIGSGRSDQTAMVRNEAIRAVLDHGGWQIAAVSSPLATGDSEDMPDVIGLMGVFPLMRYLNAFDAAISAAGYNSVHELIPAGVPTLLIPKSASKTDDQLARASYLAEHGMALISDDSDLSGVRRRVQELLGPGGERLRERLANADTDDMTGGAREVAGLLTGSPPVGVRDSGRHEMVQGGFKGVVKRMIGPTGVRLVQRALGREVEQPRRTIVSRQATGSDAATLVITSNVDAVAETTERAVEHILPEASPDYENARRGMIDDFYEVRD